MAVTNPPRIDPKIIPGATRAKIPSQAEEITSFEDAFFLCGKIMFNCQKPIK